MWAVGATALVSFGLTLFAMQSKVRSVTHFDLSLLCSTAASGVSAAGNELTLRGPEPSRELLCLLRRLLCGNRWKGESSEPVCRPGKRLIPAVISAFVSQVNSARPARGQS